MRSDHELIYCSWKTPLLKLNEEISFKSVKNYSDKNFVEKLTKFPDYSNHTCVNNAYQTLLLPFYVELILFHKLEL